MKTSILSSAMTILLSAALIMSFSSIQAQASTNGWEDDDFFLDWYPSSDNPNGGQSGQANEASDMLTLVAYPSPASGDMIEVSYENLLATSKVSVHTADGKPVFSQVVGDQRDINGNITIPISTYASGLYIVKLVSGNIEKIQKILIQR